MGVFPITTVILCVHFCNNYHNYTDHRDTEDTILSIGQWSDRGCSRNESLSNTSVTVCECTHLTHFAILLSAAPLPLSEPVQLSLQIIGYLGVAVSLVAMALTITTFIMLKYCCYVITWINGP